MSVKKLITVAAYGYLPEIKLSGPVKTPTYVKIEAVKSLVLNGRRVFEHNPANVSEKVLLQPTTYAKVNFGSTETNMTKDVSTEPKVNQEIPDEKPVETPDENTKIDEVDESEKSDDHTDEAATDTTTEVAEQKADESQPEVVSETTTTDVTSEGMEQDEAEKSVDTTVKPQQNQSKKNRKNKK